MLSLLFACPALIGEGRSGWGWAVDWVLPPPGAAGVAFLQSLPFWLPDQSGCQLLLYRTPSTTTPLPPSSPTYTHLHTDALLEPDGLRPVTLVARDAAHLASALGARAPDMADLWCQLARRVDPRLAAAGTAVALPQGGWAGAGLAGGWWGGACLPAALGCVTFPWPVQPAPLFGSCQLAQPHPCPAPPSPAALEVVQRAVRSDPAGHQRLRTTDGGCCWSTATLVGMRAAQDACAAAWATLVTVVLIESPAGCSASPAAPHFHPAACCLAAAEKEYRVTRNELKGLPYATEVSYSFWANTIKK